LLTGICQFQRTHKLVVGPFQLHEHLVQMIEREAENARRGLPARIIAKLNSLAERQIIEALYRASEAGVKIELIVRGICCLRPGMKGVSKNISVRSVVDRFLEHSRIYYFENACQPQLFIASADWLPRNFFRRIELAFPIEDGNLRERLIHEVLEGSLADNVKARVLSPDGSYQRTKPARGQKTYRSQVEFLALSAVEQSTRPSSPDGKSLFPQVKLAPSPFAIKTGN
jgi:polyphosphate kinase